MAGVELLSDPIIARVCTREYGREFRLSDMLVCEKLTGSRMTFAVGKDCVVETSDGYQQFGLLTISEANPESYDLTRTGRDDAQYKSLTLQWAAPVMFINRVD
jgi:hypothetical protein